ncbi:hypothetical protein [Brevibacillus daliensis]|uniref:hypothetical protein n=1 Tax=Brevibacillus daliensis TaxID=2892995 RepID=UPI001E344ABC|nr:hypothetical protein [Brevibacillus daliensis]
MKRSDALYNWLQIRVVLDERPDDLSAQDTESFFKQILVEDHKLNMLTYVREELHYVLTYVTEEGPKETKFDRDAVELLLTAIQAEPKYAE